MAISNQAIRWLNTPPAQWNQKLKSKDNRFMAEGMHSLCDELANIAQRAAMLSTYVEKVTGADGCGRKEHAEAVKAANKRLVKIRKAFGYTYPESATFNF